MVQCPVCKGSKKQIYSSTRAGHRGKIFSVEEVACPLCKGNGSVSYKMEQQFILNNSQEVGPLETV